MSGPDVEEIGEGHGDDHRPDTLSEAVFGDDNPAQQPTRNEADDAHIPQDHADLQGGQAQAALAVGVQHEGAGHLGQHGFTETVKQNEKQDRDDLRFREEGGNDFDERGVFFLRGFLLHRTIMGHHRHPKHRVEQQQPVGARPNQQRYSPGFRDGHPLLFVIAGHHDQKPIRKHHGQPKEGRANAREEGLHLLRQGQHIVAIQRNIVRGGEKGSGEEDPQRNGQKGLSRNGQGGPAQKSRDQHLHREHPRALLAVEVEPRRPQHLEDPGPDDQARP